MKKLLVFASGTESGGGSGFENLVNASRDGRLEADIVGVVSNIEHGGVRERAERLGILFIYFPAPYDAEHYQQIVKDTEADFVALSGWMKLARGLDATKTINIHPAPLPAFGGKGMHGRALYEKLLEAYKAGEITESEISMHFVTEHFDEGRVFFTAKVPILPGDTPETLEERTKNIEHEYQPMGTNRLITGNVT